MSQRYGLCVSARTSPRPTFEPVEPNPERPEFDRTENFVEALGSLVWAGGQD